MLISSFAAGLRALRARPGLAALLYLTNLALAVVLAVPIGAALDMAVSRTGFSPDLAGGLDVVLLADIFERHGDFFAIMIAQLVWIVPLAAAWKAAVGVGLVHALRDGGARSFWSGVGRFGGRGILLAGVFLVPVVVWMVGTAVLGIALTAIWPGEVSVFRTWFVLVPTLVITGLSVTDLMHDCGRMALVLRDRPVFTAFTEGLLFPFRHPTAGLLYILWFVPAALFWLLPTVIEAAVGASLLIFLVQQVLMLGRAATTVGWFGSEVALYERIEPEPAIAEALPTDEGATSELAVGLA